VDSTGQVVPQPYIDAQGLVWTIYNNTDGRPDADFGFTVYNSSDCTGPKYAVVLPPASVAGFRLDPDSVAFAILDNGVTDLGFFKLSAGATVLPVPATTSQLAGSPVTCFTYSPNPANKMALFSDLVQVSRPTFQVQAPVHWEMR
jgi:hypothetical protein